jgi:hypothetical protein
MSAGAARPGTRALRVLAAWTLIGLALQFLLGMLVNLFVQIPAAHPGANGGYFAGVPRVVAWALGAGAFALRLHVALGIALFVAGIVLLGMAIGARRRAWVWSATLGLFGVFGAAGNGASFLIFHHDFSSFLMSLGFTIAAAAYVAGICAER